MKKFALTTVLLLAVTALVSPQASADGLLMPIISVNPTSVDFGEVPVGSATWVSVLITNSGDAPLVISAIKTKAPYYDGVTTRTIPAHSSSRFDILFAPSTTGTFNSVCTILSNAANAPRVDIPLTGVGI